MTYFTLGNEILNTEEYALLATAVSDDVAEYLVNLLNKAESDEPIQTEAYQDIDPNSTYGSFPTDEDWDALRGDWLDVTGRNN